MTSGVCSILHDMRQAVPVIGPGLRVAQMSIPTHLFGIGINIIIAQIKACIVASTWSSSSSTTGSGTMRRENRVGFATNGSHLFQIYFKVFSRRRPRATGMLIIGVALGSPRFKDRQRLGRILLKSNLAERRANWTKLFSYIRIYTPAISNSIVSIDCIA